MIRFVAPWVLLAIPAATLLLLLLFRLRWPRLVVRTLVLALLLLALSRPELSLIRQDQTTMILLDRSESLRVAQSDMDTFALIQELVEANPTQRFGLIEFADVASIVYPPGEYRASLFPAIANAPVTHLQPAVELALASMNGGQIVLLSDGRFSDRAGVAAARAQAVDVPIHVLPLGEPVADDLSLSSLTAPNATAVGRPFALRLDVDAPDEASARLVVYRDDNLLLADDVELARGRNSFAFTDTLLEEGVFSYRAFIRSSSDPISDNDSLSTSVQSTELASVLVMDGAQTGIVPRLLDANGVPYDATSNVPSMETLSQYRQLILADVELGQITAAEAERVEHFVRNMGGGLFIIQGERAVRGFASTELDELLPVSSTVPEVQQEASLAIVFVLDRSNSMKGLVRTPASRQQDTTMHAKIRIVRDATAASVSLLPGNTQVGIIGFNTEFDWLRPISPIDDLANIMGILRRLSAGGGTDIYYPLEAAVEALGGVEARFKHVLLISDGWTLPEPRDYDGLLARLRADEDIVVSIIAADEKPNFELLEAIAEAGHGELYHVPQFTQLPATMLDITQRLSRSRFVLEPSEVTGVLAERLAPLSIPPVGGYILTYPRSDATVYAWAGDDPLFATWNVGLGVVSVLNTDLTGAWTGGWTAWPSLSQLFGEMFVLAEPSTFTASGIHAAVTVGEDHVEVLADARDEAGNYADWLSLRSELLPLPDVLDLTQVASGLYRGTFDRPATGGYALRVTDTTRGSAVQIPVTVPYPAEFAATGADPDALASIAALTGGVMLSEGDLVLTEERRYSHRAYVSIHAHLLWAAAAILLAELIYLRWPRRRIREARREPGQR